MKEELIVLVDESGSPIGQAPKLESHNLNTPLHLAFSVYIFNKKGQLLVTKRASDKKVWPDVWTNSCCGHPLPGEQFADAIVRRTDYELGMSVDDIKMVVSDYRYKTPVYKDIIENEFCPIFIAISNDKPTSNASEVEDYKWLDPQEYIKQTQNDSEDVWSWWCKDQMKHLMKTSEFTKYLTH